MSDMNRATLIGRLGRDPEVRTMPNGDGVCNLSVATSERWKDKNTGEQKERTEWHRVVLFGKLSDIAGKYLTKGSKIFIEGQIQTRKWTDQSGVEKYSTEIVCRGFDAKLIMLDGKENISGNNQPDVSGNAGSSSAPGGGLDDEIPFSPHRGL